MMIYISAQPAEYYFLWQLEIQLQNFEDIQIPKEEIHVLLGYNPQKGIPSFFKEFTDNNKQANFYYYPDRRIKPLYLSSIRPHILQQHFEKFPYLSQHLIFYHDSDIIFREKLNAKLFEDNDLWYFSDTRSYVGATRLKSGGNSFFEELCDLVEIDPKIVEAKEQHSGGAQHVMKGVNSEFWKLVEVDSEKIFSFLIKKNTEKDIQAWCSDMWSVLWNAWKLHIEVRLHKELDFCWPKDHISRYYQTKILHNSGVFAKDKSQYFCKLLYKKVNPYFVDYSFVDNESCSKIFVDYINVLAGRQRKVDLNSATIVVLLSESSQADHDKIKNYLNYLYKHLCIQIWLVEQSETRLFNKELPKGIGYHFLGKGNLTTWVAREVNTEKFVFCDVSILLPIESIIESLAVLEVKENILVIPYNNINDALTFNFGSFKETLSLNLDELQSQSFNATSLNNVEAFAVSKADYLSMGGDNLNFVFFVEEGFNLERIARARILGKDIQQIERTAFKYFPIISRKVAKRNNSLKDYLVLTKMNRECVERKIAYGKYSYNVECEEKYIGATITPKFLVSYPNSYTKESLEYILKDYFQIIDCSMWGELSVFRNLKSAIAKSKRLNVDFLVFISEQLAAETVNNLNVLAIAISHMEKRGLQIIVGNCFENWEFDKVLSKDLLWISPLPQNSLMVIHRSLFNSVLRFDFDESKPVFYGLSELTEGIGLISPFIGSPSDITLDDRDRMNIMKRFEDKANWILCNRIVDEIG